MIKVLYTLFTEEAPEIIFGAFDGCTPPLGRVSRIPLLSKRGIRAESANALVRMQGAFGAYAPKTKENETVAVTISFLCQRCVGDSNP